MRRGRRGRETRYKQRKNTRQRSRAEERDDVGEAFAKPTSAKDEDDSEEENDELSPAGLAKRRKIESVSDYGQPYKPTDYGMPYRPTDY